MSSVAAAYGSPGLEVKDSKAEAAEDDPLGIEAAFDKIDSTHPGVDVDDDPLGLDAAFDVAFPCPAGEGSDVQSELSRPPSTESDSSEDPSNKSMMDCDTDGAEEGSAPSFYRDAVRMRKQSSFRRDGKGVLWNNKVIGSITSWGNSVSCHCRVHARCRSPASTRWQSDEALEVWLLQAIDRSGEQRMDRAEHQAKIIAMHADLRVSR